MTVTTVDIREAQAQLLHLLALALQGGDVVISKDDVPIAKLVPIEAQTKRRVAGLHPGAMQMSDDFNAPLPDDFWMGNE